MKEFRSVFLRVRRSRPPSRSAAARNIPARTSSSSCRPSPNAICRQPSSKGCKFFFDSSSVPSEVESQTIRGQSGREGSSSPGGGGTTRPHRRYPNHPLLRRAAGERRERIGDAGTNRSGRHAYKRGGTREIRGRVGASATCPRLFVALRRRSRIAASGAVTFRQRHLVVARQPQSV